MAISHLFGVPAKEIMIQEIEEKETFWRTLKSAHWRNFVILSSSLAKEEMKQNHGIIPSHAYSILDVPDFAH